MYLLPSVLPKDLKLRMLGNWEHLEKFLKYLELMASTQSATKKAKFGSCATKFAKVNFKTFHKKTYFT